MKRNLFFLAIMLVYFSCSDKEFYYENYFNLHNYFKISFDLYNPVLNRYKMTRDEMKKDTNYFYTGYFKNDTLLYIRCKYDSYSYLGKLKYNGIGLLQYIEMYPLLNSNYNPVEETSKITYYYQNDSLKIIKDEFEDKLIFVNPDTLIIYNGLLNTSDYIVQKRLKNNFYIQLLNE